MTMLMGLWVLVPPVLADVQDQGGGASKIEVLIVVVCTLVLVRILTKPS